MCPPLSAAGLGTSSPFWSLMTCIELTEQTDTFEPWRLWCRDPMWTTWHPDVDWKRLGGLPPNRLTSSHSRDWLFHEQTLPWQCIPGCNGVCMESIEILLLTRSRTLLWWLLWAGSIGESDSLQRTSTLTALHRRWGGRRSGTASWLELSMQVCGGLTITASGDVLMRSTDDPLSVWLITCRGLRERTLGFARVLKCVPSSYCECVCVCVSKCM